MPKRELEIEDDQERVSSSEKRRKKDDCSNVRTPLRKLKPDDYTVGWICAIKVEYVAAQEFLDEEHEGPDYVSPHDNNNYTLGSVGKHNVVIATLPLGEYGIASAATVARDMMHSFPNVRIGLMVGIGGGVPSENHDIRLGDIVVSAPKDGSGGLLQYDFGKNIQDQIFLTTGVLNQPPVTLRTALAGLQAQYERKGHQIDEAVNSVLEKNKRLRRQYKRPAQSSDRLYQTGVVHPSAKESCVTACDPSGLISRSERDEDEESPAIHYGLIASANQLMKNALLRDKLAVEKDVLCFEMEAAGLMNHFPCLVIRGICDYADSHKNKEWQGYAAMVAAAYAKDLLYQIAPNGVTTEKRISDILSDVKEVVNGVEKGVHKLVNKQYSHEHKAVLDWLTPIDYALQQNDFISRRQEGTGRWFLKSVEFQVWLKTNRQTLFCPGIPGAGKTIITAIVIDHLLANFRDDPKIGIAYIYCNFRQQDEQTAEKLLTNLLKQLVQTQSSLPKDVKDLYDKHEKSRTRPSHSEITTALHSIVTANSKTFIVIDALDECQDLSRLRFLDEIFSLQVGTGANIFATSRINDSIRRRFDGCATVEISATDRDVLAYLDGKMSLRRSAIINGDIQDRIRTGVLKAAGGMFLLATFHIDTIMSQPSRGEIKEVLQKLGSGVEGLHEIYTQAMERIESHTPAIRYLARRILTWITHAKRPLSIIEIQHALAVREHMTAFDPDYLSDAKDLKSVCAGLVTIDGESGIIRLVHYTTQEFFQQTQERWFPEAESYITRVCITYLSFDTFESGFCHTNEEYEERLQSNSLYHYAAHNWGHHARDASTIYQEVIDFLESEEKVKASGQALMGFSPKPSLYWHSSLFRKEMTGLHLAAYFGIEKVVAYLLQKGDDHPDSTDVYGRTPLWNAARNGHIAVVAQLLATRQVDAGLKYEKRETPLFCAVQKNHKGIVKLLLKAGANVNSGDIYSGTVPLLHAAKRGYVAIAKLLLEKRAVVDVEDRDGKTPLLCAIGYGHETMVRLLLDNGCNLESKDHQHNTPLSRAIEKGHVAIVQLLLDKGANINSKGKYEWTPLFWAINLARDAIIQLLLDKGADLESKDNESGRTPLSWAVAGGHTATVQLLLDKGADLESKDNESGRTPLSWAAAGGHTATVQLLLDKGANSETKDNKSGRTPLSWAAGEGHIATVRLLLDKGADLEPKDNESGRTPLSWAAWKGYTATVQLLLDKSADLEPKDSKSGRTPLSWAAWKGHTTTVQLLLDKGADLESKDEFGQTPLLNAAENGHSDTLQLLLDKGADLESKDEFGRTSLSWAAKYGHTATVQLLLDKGADLESKDEFSQTSLLNAAENGHLDTVQLLLNKGADLESKDEFGQTPLLNAAENGYSDTVRLLLDKGADINSKDNDGRTPLSWVVENNPWETDTVQLLLDEGADVNSKDNDGRTPLSWVVENSPWDTDTIQLLLDKGADINSKDNDGRTLLLWVVENSPWDTDTIQLLHDKGADINSKDNDGRTPLLWVVENNPWDTDTIQLLLDEGADINSKDNDGRTPLSKVAGNGHKATVQLLLDNSADRNIQDNISWTPLLWAAVNGHADTVQLLLDKGADIDFVGWLSQTPPSRAAGRGHNAIV